jgi:hypothetical protein
MLHTVLRLSLELVFGLLDTFGPKWDDNRFGQVEIKVGSFRKSLENVENHKIIEREVIHYQTYVIRKGP